MICAYGEAAPARSPTRPPIDCTLWVAGWGSGPVPPSRKHLKHARRCRSLASRRGRVRHARAGNRNRDRKRVVEGKSVSVRVDLGSRRIMKKKRTTTKVNVKHTMNKKTRTKTQK